MVLLLFKMTKGEENKPVETVIGKLFKTKFVYVFGFFVFGGLGATIYQFIADIKEGKGLDSFMTGYGVPSSAYVAIATIISIPVVFLIGCGIQYYINRHKRDFERKYGDKN